MRAPLPLPRTSQDPRPARPDRDRRQHRTPRRPRVTRPPAQTDDRIPELSHRTRAHHPAMVARQEVVTPASRSPTESLTVGDQQRTARRRSRIEDGYGLYARTSCQPPSGDSSRSTERTTTDEATAVPTPSTPTRTSTSAPSTTPEPRHRESTVPSVEGMQARAQDRRAG